MRNDPRGAPDQPPRTLVCFALKEEAAAFRRQSAGRADLAILVTGIGRRNAEQAVRDFLQTNAVQTVFTCGFAGGLKPQLNLGSVLFETEHPALQQKLEAAGAAAGKFHCADRIAVTVEEKTRLRAATHADAVEMESAAVQAVCREFQIPCATVRVISDAADDDLPLDFNQLSKPDLSLDYGKLARAIVRAPKKIPALMKLQRTTRHAAMELARVLMRVWAPPHPGRGEK